MINLVRSGLTFSNTGLRHPSWPDAPPVPAKKPMPTDKDTALTKPISTRSIPTKGSHPTAWKAIAWETHIQSGTPDGKFGPAKQMAGWGDCWFLASLAAVANDKDGRKILAQSIKKAREDGLEGYHIIFAGLPNHKIFISDNKLNKYLDTNGGDADTRLIELAADQFFSENGNFKSMYLAYFLKAGQNQGQTEKSFRKFCRDYSIMDPMTHNPMRFGGFTELGLFMLDGLISKGFVSDYQTKKSDVLQFLYKYFIDDSDGTSVVINGQLNPLGLGHYAQTLTIGWDAIRTDIASNGTVDPQERAFLKALDQWLETYKNDDFEALKSAADNLQLQHYKNPVKFVKYLSAGRGDMWPHQINLLQSGVKQLLTGGTGYIGFPGRHSGILYGINEAQDTFTYSEPHFPTMVHTGKLSDLITAIIWGDATMRTAEPKIDEADYEHQELLEQLTPLQALRRALTTLNVKPVRELVEFLEYLDNKGEPYNNRYGLYGVWKLSQLDLDSPLWNELMAPKGKGYIIPFKPESIGIRPEYRQMIKDMAHRIIDPQNKSLMQDVHGPDGIFDPGELKNWLSKHHRNGTEPDAGLFQKFYKSVQDLNAEGVGIMDWLEWQADPKKADSDNGRFGMRGVQLLAGLTVASQQWEASGSGQLDDTWRRRLIDAAKVLMNSEYDPWTFQMHKGDQIFEPNDMQNWLADNKLRTQS